MHEMTNLERALGSGTVREEAHRRWQENQNARMAWVLSQFEPVPFERFCILPRAREVLVLRMRRGSRVRIYPGTAKVGPRAGPIRRPRR